MNIPVQYIDTSVLPEITPLVKFIRNYIRDLSISSRLRILLMTPFPAFPQLFEQSLFVYTVRKKITRWLEDMNFLFLC